MYYFSELVNKKVVNDKNKTIGKLKDILFLAEESPKITKIFVKRGKKKLFGIPIKDLIKINGQIVVNKDFDWVIYIAHYEVFRLGQKLCAQ